MDKRSLSGALAHHGQAAAPNSGFKFTAAHFISTYVVTPLTAAWHVILEMRRRRESQQVLRSLSVREIRDFCSDLMKAERESRKPFWRA